MMYAPENQTSNERESAAQMAAKATTNLAIYDCFALVHLLNEQTEVDRKRSVDHQLTADARLKARQAYEQLLAARDGIEKAIGHIRKAAKLNGTEE